MTATTAQILTEWFKIQEILGPEFRNNLPASVEAIKTERDKLRQHLDDLRAAIDNQEDLVSVAEIHNKELQRQLTVCRKALEDISCGSYDSGFAMDLATDALNQLPEN